MRLPLLALLCLCFLASGQPASAQSFEERLEWNRRVPPFRIVGNVYYVGTAGIGIYLITDPEGHILLDGGLPESAAVVAANIRDLGFRVEDIKYLLNSHAHMDHAGGLAELKAVTGAQLVASAGDRPELERGTVSYRESAAFPPVKVDRVVADGEGLTVGAARMTAHVTPGHTKGCTTWTTRVTHEGRLLDLLFSCSVTVAGQPLVDDKGYPQAAADFAATFARLKRMRADIFLANHPVFFDMEAKRERLAAGDAEAFIRPDELALYVARWEAAFAEELEKQRAAKR